MESEVRILKKKTSYARSISLTQDEFDACSRMEYDEIEVSSPVGKIFKKLPSPIYSKLLTRARLLLVNDDPENKHYWVLNF